MTTELLLGDEAVGLAALHAGVRGVFSYPGTPATEIFEFVEQRSAGDGAVWARWSANEKVAYEEALGMSYAGRRALVAMKHVGLNVAADPFMSSALTGVQGGLVLAVADDPGMHSSQNEQDSRYYAEFAQIPAFEPSDQQECYDLTREAFELSEKLALPVMIRLVTRLAHSRSGVNVAADPPVAPVRPPVSEWRDWTLLPVNARRRYQRLVEMQPAILSYTENSPANKLHIGGARGVIACGIAYNYVREALGAQERVSILKISSYPIPTALVRRLVSHCQDIFVVEEGYPFVERRLVGLLGLSGKNIRGKLTGELPIRGELTPDNVAAALNGEGPAAVPAPSEIAERPPQLCQGCPHCDAFWAIGLATAKHGGRILFSDIGCYTLAAAPPFSAVHSCVDMGASISMAHGAARAGVYPVLCTIGDSTFTHSGMTALLDAVRSDADMTVVILDNGVVGMTGGQETLATGEELVSILRGLGVPSDHLRVIEPVPRRLEENTRVFEREIAHRGLSVIVARRPCIHARRRAQEAPVETLAGVPSACDA